MAEAPSLERDVWAAVDGIASADQLSRLEGDPRGWRSTLERLLRETEESLESVRTIQGDEREQIVADVEAELDRLEFAYQRFQKAPAPGAAVLIAVDPPDEVRLQASWAEGRLVVWAAGATTAPATNGELADRLEAIGGPALGWSVHPSVPLPSGVRAEALSIPIEESLGWLVAVAGTEERVDDDELAPEARLGSSVLWLARVALTGVRTVARGAVVPTLQTGKRRDGKPVEVAVRWAPALLDDAELDELTDAMPGPVAALSTADAASLTLDVLRAIVDTIVRGAAGLLQLPAPPPVTRTSAALAEAVITRLDGSQFEAPAAAASEVSNRMQRWARPVTSRSRPRLVVQLDPPDKGNAWFLSVLGPGAEGPLLPIELALGDSKKPTGLADELLRLERLLPVLLRPGAMRRGQVYLSQVEAWELMTDIGPTLVDAGFDVRVPSLSRRKAKPSLRLFTEPAGETVVGAHQLSNVRWSAVFDDVELTAADIAKLAAEARPLVRSHGAWIELDRADLKEAAAALAERASKTQLTGAEILRQAVGLEGTALDGISVEGTGWATELLEKAKHVTTDLEVTPDGFAGELRSYQAEALAWLGFLDAVELGGCLALDMGLGKTPTVLAHLARTAHDERGGRALVIAPPAVVGNWAAEAARFAPKLKVVVHHGASRATADELEAEVADADVVITTYGTAVRDIDALESLTWDRVVLDEAQAIKNPANETSQQLRRLPARSRIALTGTPIENGLGDLWAILDFTNPGLVGSRPSFIAQMSGDGEAALRALNG
ncbi:MAG: hypothetical protein QOD30_77, partial [Actinomycetota bacterium]|nr:hypothetical protein [Actinomycetota bacterium]